jgi:glycosyltransferase involved in cell wall biosynthesis
MPRAWSEAVDDVAFRHRREAEGLHIVLVYGNYPVVNSGGGGAVSQLLLEYRRLGHQVRLCSFADLPEWLPSKAKSVVFPYFVVAYLAGLAWKQEINVVDVSSGDAWLWAMTRRTLRNDSLLVTRSHGLQHLHHLEALQEASQGKLRLSWKYFLYHGGFRLWEVANSFRRADLALFLNRHELDHAVRELDVRPERTRTVANGIPDTFLDFPFAATPASKDDPIRIAVIGSYLRRKGVGYAAPALGRVLLRHPEVRVSFLGTHCQADQVLADYDPLVRERIRVVPCYLRAELPALLEGHHIKLFPTLSEGFGMALLEAMACGLAPVVTFAPGPLEIVRDGHDALVIPTHDSRAIEQALERVVSDRALLDRLRRNAHATAQAYGWSWIARQTLQLYEEFLQGKEQGQGLSR